MDYARSFAELGKKPYQIYIDFKVKYKLNHDVLINFLSLDSPITTESFKKGKLRVDDEARSHDLCAKLLDFAPLYDRYNYRAFAFAFKTMWNNENYEHKRMLDKLRDKKLEDYATANDYLRALEKLYNHALPSSKKIRFF